MARPQVARRNDEATWGHAQINKIKKCNRQKKFSFKLNSSTFITGKSACCGNKLTYQ